MRDIRRMTNATLAGSVESFVFFFFSFSGFFFVIIFCTIILVYSRGTALRSLEKRIGEIQEYVSDVRAGKVCFD